MSEPETAPTAKVSNPPERIWLNYGAETECEHSECAGVTWSVNQVHASDVLYVRSDLAREFAVSRRDLDDDGRLMRALSDAHQTIEDVCAALGDRDSTAPRTLALRIADERKEAMRERDELRREVRELARKGEPMTHRHERDALRAERDEIRLSYCSLMEAYRGGDGRVTANKLGWGYLFEEDGKSCQ